MKLNQSSLGFYTRCLPLKGTFFWLFFALMTYVFGTSKISHFFKLFFSKRKEKKLSCVSIYSVLHWKPLNL